MLYLLSIFLMFLSLSYGTDETTKPNIIFIFADDWGWNDVSYSGSSLVNTPNLDALAANGLKLESHYVQPTCTPTRAAFLSGRYPIHLGMQHTTVEPGDTWGLPLSESLLPEQLSLLGYSTHMIGKWHLGFCAWEYTPTYRGFDTFSGFYLGAEDYWGHNRSVSLDDGTSLFGYDLRKQEETVTDAYGTYGTYWQYNEFESIINEITESSESDPFFIYLSWQNSHNPSQAPKSYLKKYSGIATGARKYFSAQTQVLDDVMLNVVNLLNDKNLWENTLIIFSSDNGGYKDNGDNAPLRGAKDTLWEGGIRVPAFITGGYLNDNLRGLTYDQLIHVTDWYPTILSLAGGDINSLKESGKSLDGYDISSLVQSDSINDLELERDEILLNIDPVNCFSTVCGAVRYKQWKYIWTTNGVGSLSTCTWNRDFFDSSDFTNHLLLCSKNDVTSDIPDDVNTDACNCQLSGCLFDIENDPCEYYDLSLQYPEIASVLKQKLLTFNDSQSSPLALLYDKDYDGADPANYDDFWSPWLSTDELIALVYTNENTNILESPKPKIQKKTTSANKVEQNIKSLFETESFMVYFCLGLVCTIFCAAFCGFSCFRQKILQTQDEENIPLIKNRGNKIDHDNVPIINMNQNENQIPISNPFYHVNIAK